MVESVAIGLRALLGRYLGLIGAVLAALILTGSGWVVWHHYRTTIAETGRDLRNLDLVMAEQTIGYIALIDLLLRRIELHSSDIGIETPNEFNRRMGDASMHDDVTKRITTLNFQAIAAFNADRMLINRTMDNTGPAFSIADRDYFQALRDHPEMPLAVGAPAVSRGTNPMSFCLARRVSGPDGVFLGLVLASVDASELATFYRTIRNTQGVRVALMRHDGIVLARFPGTRPAGGPVGSQSYSTVQAGGGVFRAQNLTSPVLETAVGEESPLAGWPGEKAYIVVLATGFAAMFVALFWSIGRRIRQQQAQNIALAHSAEAWKQSENRLRDYAELASDWFWEQDAEFRFTALGLITPLRAPGEFAHLGRRPWETLDISGDPQGWARHMADLEAHLPFHDFRYDQIDVDGQVYHISISGRPVHDDAGRFTGYRGIGRNITAQVRANQELERARTDAEQAKDLLQDAIDSISEGFVIFDAQGRLVTANDAASGIYGHESGSDQGKSKEELLRRGLREGEFLDAIGREEEWLQERLRRHEEATGSTEQPLKGGRWVQLTERRMRNGGVAGLRVDITALKLGQLALAESETRLDRALTIAGIGSWELDLATGTYTWSKQVFHIRGRPLDFRPTRENMRLCEHHEDSPMVSQWLDDLQAGRERKPIEFRGLRLDGVVRLLRLDGRSDASAGGSPQRLFGTVQDVTDQRQIERQLAQAQKMEAIGNVTGGLAHDLNNMLGITLGNLELLKPRLTIDAHSAELFSDAMDGATRCAEFIQRLLALARRQSLELKRTAVNPLVSDIAHLLRRTLGDNIALGLRLDAGVWPVLVDPAQLEAALVNLANNARDAMPKGGRLDISTRNIRLGEGDTALKAIGPGDYVTIEVGDTGTGIPPEVVEHIFEPFFTTKAVGYGTGLGLSMVFGFVRQSGGHVLALSEPGRGTTFRLYLPRSVTDDLAPAPDAGVSEGTDHQGLSKAGGKDPPSAATAMPGVSAWVTLSVITFVALVLVYDLGLNRIALMVIKWKRARAGLGNDGATLRMENRPNIF